MYMLLGTLSMHRAQILHSEAHDCEDAFETGMRNVCLCTFFTSLKMHGKAIQETVVSVVCVTNIVAAMVSFIYTKID